MPVHKLPPGSKQKEIESRVSEIAKRTRAPQSEGENLSADELLRRCWVQKPGKPPTGLDWFDMSEDKRSGVADED